jgi:hypothetical protein
MKMNIKIAWSLLWALAIIASAWIFKGSPAALWVETALVGGALCFVILKPRPNSCRR